jgi:hypothetical protein
VLAYALAMPLASIGLGGPGKGRRRIFRLKDLNTCATLEPVVNQRDDQCIRRTRTLSPVVNQHDKLKKSINNGPADSRIINPIRNKFKFIFVFDSKSK